MVVAILGMAGLFIVNPNQAKVLQLFGDYVGTARKPGLRWANPFYTKKAVSMRTRNFETGKLKVNDKARQPDRDRRRRGLEGGRHGRGPVQRRRLHQLRPRAERVRPAQPRHPLTPTSPTSEGEMALSSHTAEMSVGLAREIQERLEQAGVEVMEARISHLAYSPEIAAAMLQRQQASAVVAARSKIVEGAVGMVEHALEMLSTEGHRRARRRAQGRHGEQPAGGALRRPPRAAGDQRRHPLPLGERTLGGAEELPLRLDPDLYEAIRNWADDEMRSVNAQIEFLLARALREAGRAPERKEENGEEGSKGTGPPLPLFSHLYAVRAL